ncbi:MAG: lipopolysaccharide biosynthesis protein [Acetobacteraceae bacterium]
MTDHARKLLSQTILYLPAQFLPPLLQFVTMIVWTHLLQPAGFGIAVFVVSAQEFAAMLAVTWWSLFVLRFRLKFRDEAEQRFRLMDSLVIACAAAVLVLLALPVLWMAGASLSLALFLSAALFLVVRTIFSHYADWIRADQRIAVFTAAQLTGAIVGSAMSILALIVLGPLPEVALAGQALGFVLGLILLFWKGGLRLRTGRFDPEIYRDAMRYGGPLIPSGVLGWAAGNVIRIVVQFSQGAAALGLLSVGWALGQRIATVLAMLFAAAAYPLAVSNIEGGDRHAALSQVSLNGVFLLTLLAPATAGVALLSTPLVTMLIAEPFRATTIVMLPIAIVVAAIRSLRIHTSDQTMILVEATHVTLYASMFEAVANTLCCVIGLWWGGLVGAALGVLVGTILSAIASFAYSIFRIGLPLPSVWTVLRIVLATSVMSMGVWMMPRPLTVTALAMTVAVGILSYATMILLTFPECRSVVGQQLRRAA